MLKIIVLMSMLLSCTSRAEPLALETIIYKQYVRDAAKYNMPVVKDKYNVFLGIYKVSKLSPELVGECRLIYLGDYTVRWIVILDTTVKFNQLRELLYHELGHCIHNFEHRQDRSSIMYETVWTSSLPWKARVKELFQPTAPKINLDEEIKDE